MTCQTTLKHNGKSKAQKQQFPAVFSFSEMVFLTDRATVSNRVLSVMFNGPRAGINFLDGFGGGNLVESNALWCDFGHVRSLFSFVFRPFGAHSW